jgi:hypothetical protein
MQQQPSYGPEHTEEVEVGVFLTFASKPNGQNHLTRIRFSRQHYSKETAEVWWQQNKIAVAERYNLTSLTPAR